MDNLSNNELIAKYLSKNMSSKEEDAFVQQLAADENLQQELAESSAVWSVTNNRKSVTNNSDAWSNINNQTKGARLFSLRKWMQLAAAVALVIMATTWMTNNTQQEQWTNIQTAELEKRAILLPDGSKVTLNGNSTLSYKANFAQRDIKLTGEAFFDVARDEKRPFTIYSNDSQTQVLGTSFNVRAYPDETQVTVTVESGKVAFASTKDEENKAILTAGYQAQLDKTNPAPLVATKNKDLNVLSWKSNHLLFDDILMKDVIIALERHFEQDIEVSTDDIKNCRFRAEYDQPSLQEILDMLAFTLNLDITRTDNTITLTGNGCK